MDGFAVDLDQLLDEFEDSEGRVLVFSLLHASHFILFSLHYEQRVELFSHLHIAQNCHVQKDEGLPQACPMPKPTELLLHSK